MIPTEFRIVVNEIYIYASAIPKGCKGHRYLVEGLSHQEPSKQQLVSVLCLTGPDKDKRFCVTPANFSTRYEDRFPVVEPERLPFVDSKPAGRLFST